MPRLAQATVIALSDSSRIKPFYEQEEAREFGFQTHDACDGRAQQTRIVEMFDLDEFRQRWGYTLPNTHAACAISHFDVLKGFAESEGDDTDVLLVAEDDCRFTSDFAPVLRELLERFGEIPFLVLADGYGEGRDFSRFGAFGRDAQISLLATRVARVRGKSYRMGEAHGVVRGAGLYLIDRKTARRYLDFVARSKGLKCPSDWFEVWVPESGADIVVLQPGLAIWEGESSLGHEPSLTLFRRKTGADGPVTFKRIAKELRARARVIRNLARITTVDCVHRLKKAMAPGGESAPVPTHSKVKPMRINVINAMPRISDAFDIDYDGFTAAIDLLAKKHQVRWLNVHPYNDDADQNAKHMYDADFVLVRSDWGWFPDYRFQSSKVASSTPSGLIIAGSSIPSNPAACQRYDVVFYETPWYEEIAKTLHPNPVQAFGVDTDLMYPPAPGAPSRDIDYLMVGRLAAFKRPWRLMDVEGRRVAVGDFSAADPDLKQKLADDGIELEGQKTYAELGELYRRTKTVFVPCELQGGGERAVLEGRACGCEIVIADDNPKLASVMEMPIYSHKDYADKLEAAITQVVSGQYRVPSSVKEKARKLMRRDIILDKLRRAPSTIVIRTRNAVKWLKKKRNAKV